MEWPSLLPLALLVLAGALRAFAHLIKSIKAQRTRLPPGPSGLPLVGILHMLGRLPHTALQKLAQRYGPIMSIRLGLVPIVVISSAHAAEQFLKTHDSIFADRPITEAGKHLSYGYKGVAFSKHGRYWRDARKLCVAQLLSRARIESFESLRRDEAGRLVKSILDSAVAHTDAVVNLSEMVGSFAVRMTCRMVLGDKCVDEDLDERKLIKLLHEGMALAGAFNIADYIPFAGLLDLQGLTRRMRAFSYFLDGFFDKIIDNHVRTRKTRGHSDFVGSMVDLLASNTMEMNIDRTHIKAIILDMLIGASDTSAAVLEWALSELFKHPHVMRKVQGELEEVVGLDRMVDEADLVKLSYLDMVVKETLRLHPAAPLLIPHEAADDCTVDGFYIPKKSRVIVNAWAIGRDPDSWPRAEEFYPERFIGSDVNVHGHDFQLIPFGSGRRSCPGMQLGLAVVRLALAQLMHCFDWELPNGIAPGDLDMTEKFGLVLPRATNLLAVPTYRLRNAAFQ